MPPLFILLLGAYVIIDSCTLGLGEYQRYCYAAVCILTAGMLAIKPRRWDFSINSIPLLQGWLAVSIIGFAMVLAQPSRHLSYVFGDAVSFTLPVLLALFTSRQPDVFTRVSSLKWIGILLIIATGVAIVFPDQQSNRFQEPSMLLVAAVWVLLTVKSRPAITLLGIVATIGVALVTLLSGARFALVIWVAMGGTLVALGLTSRAAKMIYYFGGTVIAICLALGLVGSGEMTNLSDLRVANLIDRLKAGDIYYSIVEDGSMKNRFLEADDALNTRWTQQGVAQWVFGSGHGATFETGYAYYGDRPLSDGSVHHIHFGPVLLYYRYGLPGLAVYLCFALSCFRQLLFLRWADRDHQLFAPSLVFTLGSLGILANFLLFNQLVDPIASFAMAGQVVTRQIWLQQSAQESDPARVHKRRTSPSQQRAGVPRGTIFRPSPL